MFTHYIQDKYVKLFNIYFKKVYIYTLYNEYTYYKIRKHISQNMKFRMVKCSKMITTSANALCIKISEDKQIEQLSDTLKELCFVIDNYHGNEERNLDEIISRFLPHLKRLSIIGNFVQSLDNLPSNLKVLFMNGTFNKHIDNLPKNLKILIIESYDFDMNIDNLPNNLVVLKLGGFFNKSIDNLPNNLEVLKLGQFFNKSIDKLPQKLRVLHLEDIFNQNIDNIPDSIEELSLSRFYNNSINKLPSSLKRLILYPEQLQYFACRINENVIITYQRS